LFGTPSDWSESLIVDTGAAGLASARRLMINGDGMVGYDARGQMIFNFSSTPMIRTNLVTNPSFEVNTVGWEALTNTTIAQFSSDYFVGDPTETEASLQVQASTAGSSIGFVTSSVRRMNGTAGLPYTVTAYVKVPTGQAAVGLKIGFRFYSATGTLITETVSFVTNQITSTQNWVRISNVAATAPDGTSKIGVVIYSSSAMTLGQYYLIDAVMVEQSAVLRDYFDGSTSIDQTTWDGVAHDSFSVWDNNSIYSVNGGVFTESVIQTSREAFSGVKITKDGIRGYAPGAPPTETFFLDAATGSLTINGAAPPAGDKVPVGGAAADVNSNSTTISGNKIRTGSITSNGYVGVLDGSAFSTTGTTFNLINGTISAKNWRINSSGDVFFIGAIAGGTIVIGSGASSFNVDEFGNMWLGNASFASAPFRVSAAGDVTASSLTLTNATITSSSFNTATSGNRVILSGSTITIYSQTSSGSTATGKIYFDQPSTGWLSQIQSTAGLAIGTRVLESNVASEIILNPDAGNSSFRLNLSNGSGLSSAMYGVYGQMNIYGDLLLAAAGGNPGVFKAQGNRTGGVTGGSGFVGKTDGGGNNWHVHWNGTALEFYIDATRVFTIDCAGGLLGRTI
jgi:hypothetical protein